MAPRFIANLVPRRERNSDSSGVFQALLTVKPVQYAHFWVGWLAWTCDALDFFTVSLTVPLLAKQFGVNVTSITTAITLTLLFRSLGAIIFGILSDRFGRKWPLVLNLLFCCVFSLSSGFVQTYVQFLCVRSLFGIAMGGIWGLAASSALENLPVKLRGLASGILQQGYAVGYLLAAVINLTVVPNSRYTWRTLFWFGSGVTLFAAIIRACLPESEIFLRAKALEKEKGTTTTEKTKVFFHETKEMLKTHWKLCVYAVLLMSGFNFLSHGSQDLYPTYLETTKGFSSHDATIATIIGNCGAIVGGGVAGYMSQYFGRRLTIVIMLLLVGAFIPLWILPNSFGPLSAGAFFIQFGVQGAWGVIPIQLAELSPPAFRATFPGVAYQLGNMVSAASSQIEATGGNNLKTTIYVGGQSKIVDDYATVQGIFIGTIAAYILLVTIFGPENHSSHFEKHKTAFEEGGGRDDAIMEGESVHEEDEKASEV
ncbi:carboxylic acid transporter protein [Boletus edulis]|uniref:Carboxylic acid transporter protein n=1 Tax=Boletus edulis BED1 TaxID=1328754 RepID=A0AAD4BYJ8_BOLED|nr:carboxylic acid transporter protein [Boletus edulis]KAF8443340.1 carboxylic acid transporter protein [Boletus edulis BED1]